jgi:GntR family transcriptional regulator, vanillate catabolism transcriptional regulator
MPNFPETTPSLHTIGPSMTDPSDNASEGTSQSLRAILRLRELLLGGEFAAGTRMSELPLVERLGVSRTPLRLALSTLEHEGLLELLPRGGYAVRQFTESDIADAIELRGVLEGTAARLAAERGADADILGAMHSCNEEMEPVVHRADWESFERYVGINERFHQLFLTAAASPMLERAVGGIVSLPFASASAFVMAEAELPQSREILIVAYNQHRALLEAIERREGSRAEALGREHARLASRNLEVVFENRHVLETMPGASLISPDDRTELAQAATR